MLTVIIIAVIHVALAGSLYARYWFAMRELNKRDAFVSKKATAIKSALLSVGLTLSHHNQIAYNTNTRYKNNVVLSYTDGAGFIATANWGVFIVDEVEDLISEVKELRSKKQPSNNQKQQKNGSQNNNQKKDKVPVINGHLDPPRWAGAEVIHVRNGKHVPLRAIADPDGRLEWIVKSK